MLDRICSTFHSPCYPEIAGFLLFRKEGKKTGRAGALIFLPAGRGDGQESRFTLLNITDDFHNPLAYTVKGDNLYVLERTGNIRTKVLRGNESLSVDELVLMAAVMYAG